MKLQAEIDNLEKILHSFLKYVQIELEKANEDNNNVNKDDGFSLNTNYYRTDTLMSREEFEIKGETFSGTITISTSPATPLPDINDSPPKKKYTFEKLTDSYDSLTPKEKKIIKSSLLKTLLNSNLPIEVDISDHGLTVSIETIGD